jgi:transporter family-2 protein
MTDAVPPSRPPRRRDLALAFASGGILTLMILCNGTVAGVTDGRFASLAAHGTGSVAALVALALLPGTRAPLRGVRVPAWAWLGGLAGATTVALGSVAMNSALALSGTIALGLAGQTALGLAADTWGWFGLPRRRLDRRDAATAGLILSGCLLVIFGA